MPEFRALRDSRHGREDAHAATDAGVANSGADWSFGSKLQGLTHTS
jgi:hypothetical protein